MAYKTEDLEKRILKAIKENRLFYMNDIPVFTGIAKDTLYNHFPPQSDQHKRITEALLDERTRLKVSMRAKWYQSDAPALQMGLYKLIGDEEERKRLSQQYIKQEGSINTFQVDWDQLDEETVAALYGAIKANSQGTD